jgi:hypothetical protein
MLRNVVKESGRSQFREMEEVDNYFTIYFSANVMNVKCGHFNVITLEWRRLMRHPADNPLYSFVR